MIRSVIIWTCLFIVLVNFSLIGCAGKDRGILEIVEKPTENELRRDWKEYTVYYLRSLALVYKIKDNRKILLGDSCHRSSSGPSCKTLDINIQIFEISQNNIH